MSLGHFNPMGGTSFFPENPLLKLELVLYSSFLHEPCFYSPTTEKRFDTDHEMLQHYLLFPEQSSKSRQRIFYDCVNDALHFDFQKTLELAVRARKEFFMRASPCELLAIAADHPNRVSFNKTHPLLFRNIVMEVCMIPKDMISIVDAWKSLKGSLSGFPTFLKRSFQEIIHGLSPYHMNKYRRAVIDAIRISHPRSKDLISELIKTGKLQMEEKDLTWEILRSQGKSWQETLETLHWQLPHMAALRNLRGFAMNVRNEDLIQKYCSMVEDGVLGGKQFPFRYLSAYHAVVHATTKQKNIKTLRKRDAMMITQCLENCIQKSIQNHPVLEGDVIILSDNSGSAWRALSSEHGTQSIAEIGNISALMTGLSCTGRATIGLFGDRLLEYEVDKNLSFLENYERLKELGGKSPNQVGGATENGLWLFFKRSMKDPHRYRYDHFFCYSDQQAGHGGLFGNDVDMDDTWIWRDDTMQSWIRHEKYIHLPKLVEDYRQRINPILNVFCIQTAGYNDSILPQSMYRATNFASWTGKETLYAKKVIALWDQLDLF